MNEVCVISCVRTSPTKGIDQPKLWSKFVIWWEASHQSRTVYVIKCEKCHSGVASRGQSYPMHLRFVCIKMHLRTHWMEVCISMQPLHPTLSLAIFNCVLITLQRSLGTSTFFGRGAICWEPLKICSMHLSWHSAGCLFVFEIVGGKSQRHTGLFAFWALIASYF